MKIGHTIDSNGYWTGDVLEGSGIEVNVSVICPTEGFYKPKWNGTAWVEGLTQAEIDAIKSAPKTPSLDQQISDLQDAFNAFLMGGL